VSGAAGAARLATRRLLLEPFRPEHVDFLHDLWTEPDVRRYLWDDRVIARDEVVEIVAASAASARAKPFSATPAMRGGSFRTSRPATIFATSTATPISRTFFSS